MKVVDPNHPITLRNHGRVDWKDPLEKGAPNLSKFSENEVVELLNGCIKRKAFTIIRGTPPV